MSYGYGGRSNPYDQRGDGGSGGYGGGGGGYGGSGGYGNSGGGYGAPQRQQQYDSYGSGPAASGYGGSGGGGRYDQGGSYGGSGVEMSNLQQGGGGYGQPSGGSDPKRIFNEIGEVGNMIKRIHSSIDELDSLQQRTLQEVDPRSPTKQRIDALSADTMQMYRDATQRIREIASDPEGKKPTYKPQLERVKGDLRSAINRYQEVDKRFRHKTQEQMARQIRIVRPDASEGEVKAAIQSPEQAQNIFSQALMGSQRMGQANAVLDSLNDRRQAVEKIEEQMRELAQLFMQMDELLQQQEHVVAEVEQKAEEVVVNLDKGNEEIGVAVETAKSTRKKKWICLGICVAIIIIIVVIVVVYIFVTRAANNATAPKARRSLLWDPANAPVSRIYGQSKIVVARDNWDPSVAAEIAERFADPDAPSFDRRVIAENVQLDLPVPEVD